MHMAACKKVSCADCTLTICSDTTCLLQAKQRDIRYELLPPGMHRRQLNSSRFDRRSRTILWHVEWQFPAAHQTVHDLKVSEQVPLQQILAEHLKLAPGNSLKRHALRAYAEAGLDSLHLLMRKEHCPVSLQSSSPVHQKARVCAATGPQHKLSA